MPRERLLAAVGAATDTDVLFRSLEDAAAFGAEVKPDTPDSLTGALLRGAEMKRTMLRAEGGVLSAHQQTFRFDHLHRQGTVTSFFRFCQKMMGQPRSINMPSAIRIATGEIAIAIPADVDRSKVLLRN